MTESMEQLRSNVEAEMEALRQILATEGDEVMTRLNSARSKLRHHLDALDDVTARCLDVNRTKFSISILLKTHRGLEASAAEFFCGTKELSKYKSFYLGYQEFYYGCRFF